MYLNVIQLAESFGVEESVVEGWIRNDGLPCVTDRNRLMFDRAQVVAWAAQRGLAARAGFLAGEQAHSGPGRRLETLLHAGGIWREVSGAGVRDRLETVVGKLPGATPPVRQILTQRLHAADGVSWAPVGAGLALPHLRTPIALGRDAGVLAILFLKDALPMTEPAPDGAPVTRLLFFVAPSPRAHLELLAQLSSALTRGSLRELMLAGAPDEQLFAALAAADAAGGRTEGAKT
jgi:nitrogen PTS system EIIA component